jgi:formate/nitrite transporter FocA (FNT family)
MKGESMQASTFGNAERILWGRTLWLNILRSISAGIVWSIVVLIATGGHTEPNDPPWWVIPFLAPICYVVMLGMCLFTAKLMTVMAGDMGELASNSIKTLLSLAIIVGDPLVYVLYKYNPSLVPVEKFRFVNFSFLLYVVGER